MKKKKYLIAMADLFLLPLVVFSGFILRFLRKKLLYRFPMCRSALMRIGIYPLLKHYYEPQFDFSSCNKSFIEDRNLPGISWQVDKQLNLLNQLNYVSEFNSLAEQGNMGGFHWFRQ